MENTKDALIFILAGCVVSQSNLPGWVKLGFGTVSLAFAITVLVQKLAKRH